MLAYFDCFSGISGDMTLGALVDLGVPVTWLEDSLRSMPLSGFRLVSRTAVRGGMQVHRLEVRVSEGRVSRTFADIRSLIESAALNDDIKKFSLDVFKRIAVAESAIHGCSVETVHFHEVGGTDALVDIIGTALCREYLNIDKVVASPLPLGSGPVTCRHGVLPVPAPATLAILKGIPVYDGGIREELVTPTGAALISAMTQVFKPLPLMTIRRIGYGAGSRKFDMRPNVLRVICGEEDPAADGLERDSVVMVESNIDDMNPEIYGYLMERLFADGALDVWWVPVQMKKNRPGTMLQVLCQKDAAQHIISRVLSETTTLGVRQYDVQRTMLDRKSVRIRTRFGTIAAKRITGVDGSQTVVPEHDDCRAIAISENIPLKHVYDVLTEEIRALSDPKSDMGQGRKNDP